MIMKTVSRLQESLLGKEDNYILPFFWQHGEDEATLRHYMDIIYQSNIKAVCVESRPHPDFAGPGWWHDMDIIIEEAKKRGMKVWILDDEHFPTGYAVGALKNAPVQLHHQYLDYYRLDACGPLPQIQLVIDNYIHPKQMPQWMEEDQTQYSPLYDDHLYKVIACPVVREGKIGMPIDLTHLVQDGVLVWDVPEGYYHIYVLYLTRDALGRNNYINFLDKESCRLQIDAVYEPHWEHYKEEFGKTIAGFFSDEPPIGNTPGYSSGDGIGKKTQPLPWSGYVPARMEEAFGSSQWSNYLPYLWVEAADEQLGARIRVTYMDVISKLVQECFSDQLGSWCKEHGVEYIGHIMEGESSRLGPNLVHFYRAMSGQHMSGIDNIGNCILPGGQEVMRVYETEWSGEVPFWHYAFAKMGVAQGAIDPKKKGRCMCENFGAYGWGVGVKSFKYFMDFFLVRGVNYYVPHAFTPKAFPDPDCPPHFYAHGENPQYRAFGELMAYTNRVCHLINEGKSHPIAAIVYHGESDWAGRFENCALAARALTRAQIDFHVIPADVYSQKQEYLTEIRSGKFMVNGYEYRALVIPGCEYLYKETAELACAVLEAGLPVYMTGEFPKGISNCSPEVSVEYLDRLRKAEKLSVEELPEKICNRMVCDVRLEKPFDNMTYYHYTTDSDAYFFLNEDPARTYEGKITLQTAGVPYIYDAWENRVYPVDFECDGEKTVIFLKIQPLDMTVISFDRSLQEVAAVKAQEQGEEIHLDTFEISLAEALKYPDFTPTELHDSKRSIGLDYPDFSGWIRYETKFEVTKGTDTKALLKIDDVFEAAEVYINDTYVGTRIAHPYTYDISTALTEGINTVRIDVATTLLRKIRKTYTGLSDLNVDAPLMPTGIVGEVTIYLN